MHGRIMLLLGTLTLAACATHPAYTAADSADGYGYYTTSLGDGRHRVTFNGNDNTGPNTVTDYALLRAAELTTEHGKDWFQVVEQETHTTERTTSGAGIRGSGGPVVERDCGLLGCTSTIRPAPRAGMGMEAASARTSYRVSLEIVMGSDPVPEGDGRYYDADALVKKLWESM